MGTAGLTMAPEQERGHGADKRADNWAFGAVVYEMLTGEQLFRPSLLFGAHGYSSYRSRAIKGVSPDGQWLVAYSFDRAALP
jgi:serine/threonine protein kinase